MMALMNEIDLYEHKTPLPISPTSEGTPMTETHFRQTLYECAVKLRELAYTLPQGVGELNRPGMSGDSSSWKGWGHVRWFIEEVPAGAA
ncbi:hypothetical protein [Mycobacterium tuberculosis]|uniref:hypothetical protein n=1 Tax=Mycobacterium tuberculosis TaxID=1773 RepID=UPI0010086F1A|nr:hypothetical protein [Mycobacterium tuberculosis]